MRMTQHFNMVPPPQPKAWVTVKSSTTTTTTTTILSVVYRYAYILWLIQGMKKVYLGGIELVVTLDSLELFAALWTIGGKRSIMANACRNSSTTSRIVGLLILLGSTLCIAMSTTFHTESSVALKAWCNLGSKIFSMLPDSREFRTYKYNKDNINGYCQVIQNGLNNIETIHLKCNLHMLWDFKCRLHYDILCSHIDIYCY